MPTPEFVCQQTIDSVKAQSVLIMLNHYCEGTIANSSWAVSAQEIISFANGPDMLGRCILNVSGLDFQEKLMLNISR